MNTVVLLADAAQVASGKLYVLGGGWSVARAAGPIQMALAVRILVPWSEANESHELRIELLRADGTAVELESEPVLVSGEFEVGRPPGVPKGSDLDALFAFSLGALPLPPDEYYWQVLIDDTPTARASFRILSQA